MNDAKVVKKVKRERRREKRVNTHALFRQEE
jgi:hypothetical protein